MGSETLGAFHPAVREWFRTSFPEPTPAQAQAWPVIKGGESTLLMAPTGSGKTLAAFLSAIDALIRQGCDLKHETQILYVSPLRALSNDVQKNLQGPLAEIRALDPTVPEVRVLVRTGDTPSGERTAMTRRPPHILVTTPESLYLLLTSEGGRKMLRTVSTVIIDEIHALIRDKRGSHLALSLERLEHLAGRPIQRVGLSATQKPLDEVGRFLVGEGRACTLVDAGTFRTLDLGIEVPPSPLATVCSHEQWEEIYARIGELVREHRTTLVFVNTRKMAERISAQLTRLLGEDAVGLLDALGIDQVHWVGLSMGGMIGQCVALNHGRRLRTLALCDTSAIISHDAQPVWRERIDTVRAKGVRALLEQTLERWFTPSFLSQNPPILEVIRKEFIATPAEGYIGCMEAIRKLNYLERLPEIRIPTLILVGEDDPGAPVAVAKAMHDRISKSKLVVLPGARPGAGPVEHHRPETGMRPRGGPDTGATGCNGPVVGHRSQGCYRARAGAHNDL